MHIITKTITLLAAIAQIKCSTSVFEQEVPKLIKNFSAALRKIVIDASNGKPQSTNSALTKDDCIIVAENKNLTISVDFKMPGPKIPEDKQKEIGGMIGKLKKDLEDALKKNKIIDGELQSKPDTSYDNGIKCEIDFTADNILFDGSFQSSGGGNASSTIGSDGSSNSFQSSQSFGNGESQSSSSFSSSSSSS
ncbi:hypothetical protein EDEG_02686 [Edhazardia aedis USNM 41457]|uniref:Uncharacterized protein n=1 Tax=Edhazardia aedis (strain USNM 41457) TaxID=1003232 RepID=J9D534_EDHAE|nr:hypothetical protein EDEG_02686 [Edhazardia aedis USNM 41457]|eukprot:EJW02921.1 hypothetical protein EDEG_02686 [Edhazardia aedis USNM 41457]